MSRKTLILEPNTEDKLKKLGQRIKKARLRRNISAEMISKQAGIGESTFYAIERGVATVSIGAYAAVLFVLELDSDLDGIATDEAGKVLFWEQNIVERKRAKRRQTDKKLPVPNGITDYRKISSEYYYIFDRLLASAYFRSFLMLYCGEYRFQDRRKFFINYRTKKGILLLQKSFLTTNWKNKFFLFLFTESWICFDIVKTILFKIRNLGI